MFQLNNNDATIPTDTRLQNPTASRKLGNSLNRDFIDSALAGGLRGGWFGHKRS
jgi:hypothetical protein